MNTGKKKKEKIADSNATRLKTPSFSNDFAEISGFSENPKVKLSAEVTRQVVEMGGVGSNTFPAGYSFPGLWGAALRL